MGRLQNTASRAQRARGGGGDAQAAGASAAAAADGSSSARGVARISGAATSARHVVAAASDAAAATLMGAGGAKCGARETHIFQGGLSSDPRGRLIRCTRIKWWSGTRQLSSCRARFSEPRRPRQRQARASRLPVVALNLESRPPVRPSVQSIVSCRVARLLPSDPIAEPHRGRRAAHTHARKQKRRHTNRTSREPLPEVKLTPPHSRSLIQSSLTQYWVVLLIQFKHQVPRVANRKATASSAPY